MYRRLRVNVLKNNCVVILPNYFRGNLSCDDFFKNGHDASELQCQSRDQCKSAQSNANSNTKARSIACSRIRLLVLDPRSTGDFVLVLVLVLDCASKSFRGTRTTTSESRFNALSNPVVQNQSSLLVFRGRSRQFPRAARHRHASTI